MGAGGLIRLKKSLKIIPYLASALCIHCGRKRNLLPQWEGALNMLLNCIWWWGTEICEVGSSSLALLPHFRETHTHVYHFQLTLLSCTSNFFLFSYKAKNIISNGKQVNSAKIFSYIFFDTIKTKYVMKYQNFVIEKRSLAVGSFITYTKIHLVCLKLIRD